MKHIEALSALFIVLFSTMAVPSCGNNSPDTDGDSAALLALAGAAGPWTWVSESPTPVFTKLVTLEEDAAIGSPDVIAVRDPAGTRAFRMVFAQGGTDTRGRIGMAESPDGRSWTRTAPDGGPSILVPAEHGSWDGWFLDTPCILLHGGTWYLWYFGADSNETPGGAIGLATSSDGLRFTRASADPVLAKGAGDAWDGLWVESPVVVHDGALFVMYYTGVDQSWRPRVGRATSPDGLTWTKDAGNPVLDHGARGAWDSFAAAVPGVVYRNGHWQLFYCGISEAAALMRMRSPRIGLALSDDGSLFRKYDHNPLVGPRIAGYEPNGPYNPSVLFDEDTQRYMMWYETGLGFGLASAPDFPGM